MIYRAKVLLPVEMDPIPDGSILVNGERIADIGPFGAMQDKYPDEQVLDLKNAAVIPGLVNLHSHIELEMLSDLARPTNFIDWLKKVVERSRKMRPTDWLESARRGAARLISGGVTATADIGRWGAGAAAMRESGLRGIAYHEIVGVADRNLEEAERELVARMKAVEQTPLLRIGVSPHSAYSLSKRALAKAIEIAERKKAPIAIHVAETAEEVEMLMRGTGRLASAMKRLLGKRAVREAICGKSPVAYLDSLGAFGESTLAVHCVHVDESDIETIKAGKSAIALCPSSNSILGVGDAPVSAIREAGVWHGVGTDSAASNPRMDLFEELRLYRGLLSGQSGGSIEVTSESLLDMATIGAARILGLESEIGSLIPGKMADFVALDLSGRGEGDAYSIAEWARRSDVTATIIGGRIAFSRGF